jgi:hypothetical protein
MTSLLCFRWGIDKTRRIHARLKPKDSSAPKKKSLKFIDKSNIASCSRPARDDRKQKARKQAKCSPSFSPYFINKLESVACLWAISRTLGALTKHQKERAELEIER